MTHAARATAVELELGRRLDALAAVATIEKVDDAAWADLQERIGRARPARRRPTPRTLVAVAAAIVILCAVAVLFGHDSRQHVETIDDITTTTREGATGSSSTSTTSTTADPDDPASPSPPGAAPDGSGRGGVVGSGAAGGEGATDGSAPGAGGDASGSSGSGSGSTGAAPATPGATAPPVTSAPPPGPLPVTGPDGQPVAANLVTAQYALQVTMTESPYGDVSLHMWRPDRGRVTDWSSGLNTRPGARCLAGRNEAAFAFPEPGLHTYSWGVVASGAAQVRLVSDTGEAISAVVGSEAVPGVRPWIARRFTDQIDRFEALDAGGNVLYTASWSTSFIAVPGSC